MDRPRAVLEYPPPSQAEKTGTPALGEAEMPSDRGCSSASDSGGGRPSIPPAEAGGC